MKCARCEKTGFKRGELTDYDENGVLICMECADERDIEDKYEKDWEDDEEEEAPAA